MGKVRNFVKVCIAVFFAQRASFVLICDKLAQWQNYQFVTSGACVKVVKMGHEKAQIQLENVNVSLFSLVRKNKRFRLLTCILKNVV